MTGTATTRSVLLDINFGLSSLVRACREV
jgi:hypothetical protein